MDRTHVPWALFFLDVSSFDDLGTLFFFWGGGGGREIMMEVSKNSGFSPKMDGENNRTPY